MKIALASAAALSLVAGPMTASAQDVQRPVALSYFVDAADIAAPRLFFGESALEADDTISFEAIWEVTADSEGKCASPDSAFNATQLTLSEIILIGAPSTYADVEDLVTTVTGTLYLAAGAKETEISDELAVCQGLFLSNYYALGQDT